MAEPPGKFALLGKLRALGDKLENVATNVVSGVQTGVSTVGTGVINVAKDLKDNILDTDLDRIRSVHAFQKSQAQQQQGQTRRKQFSEQELDAADARAAVVLETLPQGYFEKDYDAVRHELSQLSEGSEQEDMDQMVEKLGICVEAVSGKLSRHVMKKRDQLIIGIDKVATVEDDLKAALATARTSRASVRCAGEEVTRHLRVAGQTRRKQAYMQLMEVVGKVQLARSLQKLLRRAQDNGEYHQAILLCVQCFQGVESLKDLSVSAELLATVQRLYVETLQKLDQALTAICGQFDPVRYTKVLDAYLLQSISGATLAERVLQCFRDSLHDSTARVAKSLLLTQPQLVQRLAGGSASLEGSFTSLVGALPAELLPTCLTQVLEVCMTGLASFHHMAQWHVECVAVQRQLVAERPPDESSIATLDFLASVSDMLGSSRKEVFNCAAQRMIAIVRVPAATAGGGLMQVAELCHRFLTIGEAFTNSELPAAREAVASVLGNAFEAQHHQNMKTLSALMQADDAWSNVGGPKLSHELPEGSVLGLAEVVLPSRSVDGRQADPKDFTSWLTSTGVSPFAPVAAASPSAAVLSGPQELQPMVTPAARHLLKCLRLYAQMFRPMGRQRAGTVWQGITELFDRFLTATFMLQSGISVDALVMQDGVVTLRLQRVMLRILTAEGSRYKAHIEELQRTKASQKPSFSAQSGMSWLDRFGDKMESLANDLDRHVSKLSTVINDKGPLGDASSHGGGLQERLAAGESLALVAAELRAAKSVMLSVMHQAAAVATQAHLAAKLSVFGNRTQSPASSHHSPSSSSSGGVRLQYEGMHQVMAAGQAQLQQHHQQPGAGSEGGAGLPVGPPPMAQTTPTLSRDADVYFNRTVEAALDLREALIQGTTKALLGRLLDPDRGAAVAVASVSAYGGREPPTNHNQWAEAVGGTLRNFTEALASRADLPQTVQDQMWVAAMSLVADALTSGYARVKKCTLEGRAAMGMDLSYVEKVARSLLPPGAAAAGIAALKRTDAFVRAYYLPWDEFSTWCQVHFAEYGSHRLIPLVEMTAEVHKVKKSQKMELLECLDMLARDM